MLGRRNTFVFTILLLAIIHDAIQTPLLPLLEESQIDRKDDDENGSLSDDDFLNALSYDFDDNEPDHDEDNDPDLYEGDIQGDKEELRAARALVNNREVVGHPGMKWPKSNGLVKVPYTIPSSLTDKTTKSEIARVIQEYAEKTCIRLVKRTTERNYIHINPFPARESTCNSALGMTGGKQTINFGVKCSWGNLAHEFMHALGFYHEHTRSDRDRYVTIQWDNINKFSEEDGRDWGHNFKKCTERNCKDLKVGYDYDSIMHYGGNLGPYKAIVPKERGARIGQRQYLSAKDLIGINEHYGCPNIYVKPTCENTWSGDCNKYKWACTSSRYPWYKEECKKACNNCPA